MADADGVPMSQMAREIFEQPEALERTLHQLAAQRTALGRLHATTRRVVLFARGSSDNAATYARYLCEIVAGIPATMGAPSVGTLYHSRLDLSGTLAIVVSQSGRTDELVEVVAWARRCGARTLAVTNDVDSPLAAAADIVVGTHAGPELAVPATKTYTTQLLALAVVVESLAAARRPFGDAMEAVPEQAEVMLAASTAAQAVAERIVGAEHVSVVGRGFSLATAAELALKIQETCGLATAGMSSADLQHGPVAVVGPHDPLLVLAGPDGPTLPGLTAVAGHGRQRGALTIGFGGDAVFRKICDASLDGPDLPEPLAPLVAVIPAQLLTEALARARGHDPDAPSGLSKVTQTA
jgi:glucosamine--fructose-6-phosphate aminotransferase (isomerizing)